MAEVQTKVVVITIAIDKDRNISLDPSPADANRGDTIRWALEVHEDLITPIVSVKPFNTAGLVPDPELTWDDDTGMSFAGGSEPQAGAEIEPGQPVEIRYLVTVQFPDENDSRTMIGSVLIVDP